jgi:hypothetical protein
MAPRTRHHQQAAAISQWQRSEVQCSQCWSVPTPPLTVCAPRPPLLSSPLLSSFLTFRYCTAPSSTTRLGSRTLGRAYNLIACTSFCVPAPAFASHSDTTGRIASRQPNRSRSSSSEAKEAMMRLPMEPRVYNNFSSFEYEQVKKIPTTMYCHLRVENSENRSGHKILR